jgi:hypothetical protein
MNRPGTHLDTGGFQNSCFKNREECSEDWMRPPGDRVSRRSAEAINIALINGVRRGNNTNSVGGYAGELFAEAGLA